MIESTCTLIELCSDVKRDDEIAKFSRKGSREDCSHMSNIFVFYALIILYWHISGKKMAKSRNLPGVTKSLMWVRLGGVEGSQENCIELLDSPGIIPARQLDQEGECERLLVLIDWFTSYCIGIQMT